LHLFFLIALLGFGLWAIWSAARPRPAFVVRIASGVPRVARGTVAGAFLSDVGDVCRRHGVRDGAVLGVVKEGRIALEFSGDISAPCRQQLRNVWSISGWSAGPA
jgi:Protein of unknown function (DUF3634)